MILDRLEHHRAYHGLGPRFAAGFEALVNMFAAPPPPGRHALGDGGLLAIVERYDTKPRSAGRWEAHRRHADIQCIVRGVERMGVIDLSATREFEAYDAERDLVFLDGTGGRFVDVDAGMFAVFMPQDAHMPGLCVEHPADVLKIVIKVPLD